MTLLLVHCLFLPQLFTPKRKDMMVIGANCYIDTTVTTELQSLNVSLETYETWQ